MTVLATYGQFEISRFGRRKELGGDGTVWMCSCPKGEDYPIRTCRHMKTFFSVQKTGTLDKRIRLTAAGRKAAKHCKCFDGTAIVVNETRGPGYQAPPEPDPVGNRAARRLEKRLRWLKKQIKTRDKARKKKK